MIRKNYIRNISWIIVGTSVLIFFILMHYSGPIFPNVVQGIITSVLASVIFYLLYHYSEEKKDDFGAEFKKVKRNSAIGGEQYWIDLIKCLACTGDDVYFYGRSLNPWLKNDVKSALSEKLKKIEKANGRKKPIYFISHVENEKLDKFLKETSSNLINSGIIKPIHIPNKENYYAIILCGRKMAITLKTPKTHGDDCPVIEVAYKSALWNTFKTYLEEIVQPEHQNIK